MAETFVKGKLYRIDGLIKDGQLVVWPALYLNTCLETAKEGKVLGAHLLSPSNPLTPKFIEYAKKILRILPTPSSTAFHLEVFVDQNEEIVFCEIASRVGGHTRDMWREAFGFNIEETFYDIQAGREVPNSVMKKSMPTGTPGYLVFPAKKGGVIEKIASQCPLSFCKDYITYGKQGDHIDPSFGIVNNVAQLTVLAQNEDDFYLKTQEVMKWFNETFQYKPIQALPQVAQNNQPIKQKALSQKLVLKHRPLSTKIRAVPTKMPKKVPPRPTTVRRKSAPLAKQKALPQKPVLKQSPLKLRTRAVPTRTPKKVSPRPTILRKKSTPLTKQKALTQKPILKQRPLKLRTRVIITKIPRKVSPQLAPLKKNIPPTVQNRKMVLTKESTLGQKRPILPKVNSLATLRNQKFQSRPTKK